MELPENTNLSFVIRIWLEETAEEAGDARWRGHITHIPSNERRYIQNLNDIVVFIEHHLTAIGVKPRNTQGGSMNSLFSFMRRRPVPSGEIGAAEPVSAVLAEILTTATPETMTLPSIITHGAPPLEDVLAAMRAALESYLPPASGSLPVPSFSIIKIEKKPIGLGNHIGQEELNHFAIALKGERLQATIRFQLWADTPNDVDQLIDALHGRLLTAKDDLWIAGFLRFAAADSPLADHISSLPAWRRTADYEILYEYRYTDTEGAQSLIARIPIHTDPEESDSPQRETAVVTDEMVRWDEENAPVLDLRGRLTVSRLSALAFVPGSAPTDPVMLLRTFAGATGPPAALPDLAQFVTAVTHPTAPERHAQVTFATFSDFLTAFSPAGDPIELGDWDEDSTPDSYQPLLLELPAPISLPDSNDHLQLVYQPGSTDPHFDQTAVLYLRAGHL